MVQIASCDLPDSSLCTIDSSRLLHQTSHNQTAHQKNNIVFGLNKDYVEKAVNCLTLLQEKRKMLTFEVRSCVILNLTCFESDTVTSAD